MREFATPESVVHALYQAISFPAGGKPDWGRLRILFLPNARLVVPRRLRGTGMYSKSFEEWIADFDVNLNPAVGFSERELASGAVTFRDIAHLFSSYESRMSDRQEPIMRGLNSVQLVRTDGRWWIASIIWDIEGEGVKLPEQFGDTSVL